MNGFVNYIIESGISLGVFSLIYFGFLRNETYFKANRLFLLFTVLFSSILPLLHLKVYQFGSSVSVVDDGNASRNMLESVTVFSSGFSKSITDLITTNNLIVFGYLAVVFVFVALFTIRIIQMTKLIRNSEVVTKQGINYVYTDGNSSPYSFLRYLFVSRNLEKNPGWEKMLAHETEHIRQGHTVDILILELVSFFQWFNPFFWLIRRVIKENHEYMADRAVLNNGVTVDLYKQILVSQYIGNQFSMANNFNSSLIKSRLKMMTKIKSSKLSGLRYISGGIIAVVLLLVFACEDKTPIQKANDANNSNVSAELINKITSNPLIIVDREIYEGDINSINPDSIRSVTVSKDAEVLVKKYGEEAKNGVIFIMTKSSQSEKQKISASENNANDQVFFMVEEMPEFPGGEEALRTFIAKTVKYPTYAVEKGIQGKVYVNFVIEKDGSVGRAKIARGVDPSLDSEALRVTTNLPKWKPGKQKGEAVAVQYTIPVNFVLQQSFIKKESFLSS